MKNIKFQIASENSSGKKGQDKSWKVFGTKKENNFTQNKKQKNTQMMKNIKDRKQNILMYKKKQMNNIIVT